MYNEIINNYNKTIRHFDTLPSCFTKYLVLMETLKAVNGYDIDYTRIIIRAWSAFSELLERHHYGQIDQFDTEI